MSQLYNTIEPNVVSESLLRRCVEEQGPEGEAGRIAKYEGIDFSEVTRLRLDFQSKDDVMQADGSSSKPLCFADILHIENLWQFTNLRKLQLDNNIIEEVKGLGTLVHLEWLGGWVWPAVVGGAAYHPILPL